MEPQQDKTPATQTTPPPSRTASVYPDTGPTGPLPEAPKMQPQSESKKTGIPVGMIVAIVIALGVGILLGRTVLKASPTPEEAAKVLFDESFEQLSDELNGFDFSN